jgi:hypothetical protein
LPTTAQIADVLRDIPNHVVLIGHADTVPVHNRRFRNNWDLSMVRGQKILELLSNRYGIPESRLSIASYGPYRPAAPNDTVDGRASNRRVEIVILDDGLGKFSSPVINALIGLSCHIALLILQAPQRISGYCVPMPLNCDRQRSASRHYFDSAAVSAASSFNNLKGVPKVAIRMH